MSITRLARVAVAFGVLGGVGLIAWSAAGRTTPVAPPAPAATPEVGLEEKYGIAVQSPRLSANGYLVDFRYRVVDPEKALPLVERTNKAYLLHQPSGKALGVPEAPTIGPLRQTAKFGKPEAGRVYFVLFGNESRLVKAGDRVTVAIGEFRAPDLVVQ